MKKGGTPHDYRSSICYHYPWVPFGEPYKIERLLPGSQDVVVVADGEVIQLNPERPEVHLSEGYLDDGEDVEKKITKMYWAYWDGEKYAKLEDTSRHYRDVNLIAETKNYEDNEFVEIIVGSNDGQAVFDGESELKLSGVVSENQVVFENVFKKYTLDHCFVERK